MKKQEVLTRLRTVRRRIIELLRSIPEDKWDEVFLGTWALRDVAAHFIGWDIENARSVREICVGKLSSCFDHWDENWVSYNEILVNRHKKGGKQELLRAMEQSHGQYLKTLKGVPDELFDKDTGLRWKNYVITPAVNAEYEAQDEELHAKQIQDYFQV